MNLESSNQPCEFVPSKLIRTRRQTFWCEIRLNQDNQSRYWVFIINMLPCSDCGWIIRFQIKSNQTWFKFYRQFCLIRPVHIFLDPDFRTPKYVHVYFVNGLEKKNQNSPYLPKPRFFLSLSCARQLLVAPSRRSPAVTHVNSIEKKRKSIFFFSTAQASRLIFTVPTSPSSAGRCWLRPAAPFPPHTSHLPHRSS